ncbi:MAG: protein-L-isoaspartate(D-aspartate) O-methyltransferase [Acidimicrobiales bacterium]|nr:protein-L-isoaspartate(D-aspartate) O-methyltransferase [Hyphomonadaceae bacterium]RZV42853.1 MAG: protein-L-isoaspartate(D-aspartate) O-methyltransferase [Acidimicrobiales bacterium]
MAFIEPGLYDMIMRLRGRGISDTNILRAMEKVPRSAFVLQSHYSEAYDEKDLPIACGQSLPAPLSVAIMCQTLDVKPDHKVLQIGTGSGYTAAILSQLCTRVYSIERYQTLVQSAEEALNKHAPNVVPKFGDGRYGWRGQTPFDRILITAGIKSPPKALIDQLKHDGRLVAVIDDMLTIIEKSGNKPKETKVLRMQLSPIEPGKAQAL